MDRSTLHDFATRYTAAWCSHNPASVSTFYSQNGSLQINQGTPSVGRAAIAAAAQDFMTTFPDLVITMDKVEIDGDNARYHWTLKGTNNGNTVRISGYEEWRFGRDELIAESKGHFDEADYQRQLRTDQR